MYRALRKRAAVLIVPSNGQGDIGDGTATPKQPEGQQRLAAVPLDQEEQPDQGGRPGQGSDRPTGKPIRPTRPG